LSCYVTWRTPKLLNGFNFESKGEAIRRKKSWGALSGSQHFGGRGACWSSEMRLGRLTSHSIIHANLHKPNNKLVSALLEHFGARTNHKQTQIHKIHHGLDLGEAITFALMVYFMLGCVTNTQMSFCPGTPKWESRNSQSWDSRNLGVYKFACRPPIQMRFQVKLQPSLSAFQWYVACHLHVRKSGWLLIFSGRESNCQINFRPFF